MLSFRAIISSVSERKTEMRNRKTELIKPIFDLDGTVIIGKIGLFNWNNPKAILKLRPEHLTELGVRIKKSEKMFDILTARGSEEKVFISGLWNLPGLLTRNFERI